MEIRGKITSLDKNLAYIEFNSSMDKIKCLIGKELDIQLKEHKEKRSLNANAYAWVLMQKIAEVIHSDKWSVYLQMLQLYSTSFTHIIVKEEAIPKLKEMYRTCVELGEVVINGVRGIEVQVYFGSSTFNTKEMSVFLDGIVRECKDLEIETYTPDMLERLKQQWDV